MYLTASRPDIMFAVCTCARDSPFDLEAFSDSDYAGASHDRKSTTGDETVIKEWEDKMERAATTTSSLEAKQDSEAQIMFEAASKQSNDPPLLRFNTLGSGKDNMKLKELMEFYTKLSERALELCDIKTDRVNYSVQYALTVNPTIYTTCIEQFWTSAKAKTFGGVSITSPSRKKEVIITETSIRMILSGLKLKEQIATMFCRIERIVFLTNKQVEGMSRHKGIYVIPSHTKKVFANMKRPGKGFSGKVTPLFETMMVQATEDMGEDLAAPTDSHSTPIHTQPSSSKPQKKKSRRKQRKDSGPTEPIPDEAINEEHVATPSCDPPQSGKDRMQLTELMDLCTQLQSRVLALETTKSNQALEIESLKRRVKSLEKRRKSRTPGFKRLRKVGSASRVESSNDVSLGAQEDASKQGRKIDDLDADAEVTLVDETQESNCNREEEARNLEVTQAELEEAERNKKTKEEKSNIALLESWSKHTSYEGHARLSICTTNANNIAGYKHNQLKSKSYDEIQEMFDKEMKKVNTFVDMNIKLVKSSETRTEGSSKRAGDELESDNLKKQKINEHVEAKKMMIKRRQR
ncbi:hypothetical protein Tco_0304465 [Tanacetum coccineum]